MEITTDINAPFTVTDVNGNEHQHMANALYDAMLSQAEKLFGCRDTKYKFLGIRHRDDGPYIWFPNVNRLEEFDIRLCFNFGESICYQLAHETIHSLAPQIGGSGTKFEEGIAVYYSLYYIRNVMKLNWTPKNKPEYEEVYQRVKRLKNKNSNSFRTLKKIREEEELSFSKLNSSQLRRIFPRSTQDDRNTLRDKFCSDESEIMASTDLQPTDGVQ